MYTLILVAFALGAAIALINIYFSAICTLTHRLREGHWPPVVPIGIPVAGTVLLLAVILLAPGGGLLSVLAALLALLDTGGPLFMLAFVRYRRRRRLQREAALR
jgi:hypothetical protein